MSKTLKSMIMRDYKSRMSTRQNGEFGDAMVISLRGLTAIQTTALRGNLQKKGVKVTVVRNHLARNVLKGSRLEQLGGLLSGSNALAYATKDDVTVVEMARELVKAQQTTPKLELKGAILEGTLFAGKQAIEDLSKFPTRAEAIANLVAQLLGPGRTLGAQLKGPGGALGGQIKGIEDKLEKGEAIAKK